jgi:hypothetical protein
MGRAFGLAAGDRSAAFEHFGTFDPGYLDKNTQLYKDLSIVREMQSFGLDLAKSASQRLSDGFGSALPYLLLIAVIGVTAWYQQRQIQGRNPQLQSQVNPQQQMLMKIFPYFLPVISFTLPAGIVLYFLVSNLYRIGQQAFITRTMYRDAHGNPIVHGSSGDDDKGKEPQKPKGLMAQLRETMAESGPRIGPNANGGPKPAPKSGGKAGANGRSGGSKGGGAKARASGSGSAASSKTGGKAGKTAPPASGSSGGAKKSKGATTASGTGEAAPAADPPRRGASPSRQPPAPNPNRSRTKKKRR